MEKFTSEQIKQYKKDVFEVLKKECRPVSRKHPKNKGNKIPQNDIKEEAARELIEENEDAIKWAMECNTDARHCAYNLCAYQDEFF